MKNYLNADRRLKPKKSDLIDLPVVVRVNKFNEETLKEFAEQISLAHQIGQPVIPVVIDSFGGGVDALIGMLTEVQNSKIPVATVVESKAMSAGAMLFAMGAEGMRFMAPHARLMLHGASAFSGGQAADLRADADELQRMNDLLFNMIEKNCGKPSGYFVEHLHDGGNADWYMTAKEAKKHNLCNHARVPTLTTKITVEFDFR